MSVQVSYCAQAYFFIAARAASTVTLRGFALRHFCSTEANAAQAPEMSPSRAPRLTVRIKRSHGRREATRARRIPEAQARFLELSRREKERASARR